MRKSLLFLDFDGCTHPGMAGTFIYMPALAGFLDNHPNIEVVLSTSWRQELSLEQLRENFPMHLQARVIDVTPIISDSPTTRYFEILFWLRSHHREFDRWAALDDDASLFPQFCNQLVLCKTSKGLRQEQLDELALRLG